MRVARASWSLVHDRRSRRTPALITSALARGADEARLNASGKTLPALLFCVLLAADGFLAGGLLGRVFAPNRGIDGLGSVLGGIAIGVLIAVVLGVVLVRRLDGRALLRCAAGASVLLLALIAVVAVGGMGSPPSA